MNILKAVLVTVLLTMGFNSIVLSQEKYEDGRFTTLVKTGSNVEKEMKFDLNLEDYNTIKNSTVFDEWFSTMEKEGKIEEKTNNIHIQTFLTSKIKGTLLELKYFKLKKGNTLDFNTNSIGNIYVDKEGNLNITYVFSAKNGYGNPIESTLIYEKSLTDNSSDEELFIID